MKEENEPDEVRGAGYASIPVRRRQSDYFASKHLATLSAGPRTPVLKRIGHWMLEVWHFVQDKSGRRPVPRKKGSRLGLPEDE